VFRWWDQILLLHPFIPISFYVTENFTTLLTLFFFSYKLLECWFLNLYHERNCTEVQLKFLNFADSMGDERECPSLYSTCITDLYCIISSSIPDFLLMMMNKSKSFHCCSFWCWEVKSSITQGINCTVKKKEKKEADEMMKCDDVLTWEFNFRSKSLSQFLLKGSPHKTFGIKAPLSVFNISSSSKTSKECKAWN
jgi:hypothetical protein